MIKTINATALRSNFRESMEHVKESRQPLVITERAVATAVLLDIDEYEDLLSAKDKVYLASIREARKSYAKGDVVEMNELFENLA